MVGYYYDMRYVVSVGLLETADPRICGSNSYVEKNRVRVRVRVITM